MLPVLWIGSLFFLTFFMSAKAKRVSVLIDATPINPRRYAIARCAAALTGTCLLVFACLAEAAYFTAAILSSMTREICCYRL